jgi:polyhydroxyalkanoate synthesis regulator phasin
MRVERGASQVLFGMLPTQTVDLQGRVWRVARWTDPLPLTLDQNTVRGALLDAIGPWIASGQDAGLAAELHARPAVDVVEVNRDRGVLVESFPSQWRCRTCGRLTQTRTAPCACGSSSIAHMHFVAYHTCGRMREPVLPQRCRTHNAIAVRLPGTATARELAFFCPDCQAPLGQGFPYQRCDCGDAMSISVHRAGAVFSPQYTVLVNPPDAAATSRLRAFGGGARALQWVVDGMRDDDDLRGKQTVEGVIESLVQQGISRDYARTIAQDLLERGEVERGSEQGEVDLPADIRDRAQEEALALRAAVDGGRVRIADMVAGTTPPQQLLYRENYPRALEAAHLSTVELLTNFPVATLAFGFTRGGVGPGQSPLVPFRERGGLRAYGALSRTEALLFQLNPSAIHDCLVRSGFDLPPASNDREARLAILSAARVPMAGEQHPQALGARLLEVLHSYTHRLIRTLAAFAGIERDALAEYLIPHHLCAIVYSAGRGEFVLGGLQAVFETALDRFLDAFVTGEARCPLDPGCRNGGGACMACLHLGEPSCRFYNGSLDRAALFGPAGLFRGPDGA